MTKTSPLVAARRSLHSSALHRQSQSFAQLRMYPTERDGCEHAKIPLGFSKPSRRLFIQRYKLMILRCTSNSIQILYYFSKVKFYFLKLIRNFKTKKYQRCTCGSPLCTLMFIFDRHAPSDSSVSHVLTTTNASEIAT